VKSEYDRLNRKAETSGLAPMSDDEKARMADLGKIVGVIETLRREIKRESNYKIVSRWREWLPKVVTLLEDDNSLALISAKRKLTKQKSAGAEYDVALKKLTIAERRAFKGFLQKRELLEISRIGSMIEAGDIPPPYMRQQ